MGEIDELKESLFYGNEKLTYVEMENIKIINAWGFRLCSNLHTAIFRIIIESTVQTVLNQKDTYFWFAIGV